MKASLIGYGYWGKIIEKNICQCKHFELVAIYDPALTENGIFTARLDAVLASREIEAAFICTPTPTHYQYCKQFLESGKHVFCEKPTVQSPEEFDDLIKIAQKNDKVLFTDYIYTVSRSVRILKSHLPDVGDLQAFSCRINQFGKFYPGETVYEVIGVHMLSALLFIIEETPIKISSFNLNCDSFGIISLVFEKDIKASIECSLVLPIRERSIMVYGSTGILRFDMLAKPSVQLWVKRNALGEWRLEKSGGWSFDEKNNLKYSLEEFNEYITQKKDLREHLWLSREVLTLLRELKYRD